MLSHGLSSTQLTCAKRQAGDDGRDATQHHGLLNHLGEPMRVAEVLAAALRQRASQAIG